MLEVRGDDQLGLAEAAAAGVVKQNGVPVALPNGGEFHLAWTVETKEHSTRFVSSHKYPLRNGILADFQRLMIAKGFVDVVSQVLQVKKLT